MRAATFFDGEEWREGTLVELDGRMLVLDEPAAPGIPRLEGVVIGGFTDHHVHLQLVDARLLVGSRLGRVVDLGGDVATLRTASVASRTVTARAGRAALGAGRAAETDRGVVEKGSEVDGAYRGVVENASDSAGVVEEAPAAGGRVVEKAPGRGGVVENASGSAGVAKRVPGAASGEARLTSHAEEGRPTEGRAGEGRAGPGDRRTRIEFAGAFLTPVGGYPSDRSWAPAGSVREIATASDAASAVAEMADAGASCVKVASNSAAGPVFDDEFFRAIVVAAAARKLTVVAHAEGPGQAQRAARLGAAALAHTPFSERLSDTEIAEQAGRVAWISTLAIHGPAERSTAVDNIRRFAAAGGTVRYGTDMGNGPTPVDLNHAELAALHEAGIEGERMLRALAPADPRDPASVLLLLPRQTSAPSDARLLKV